MYICLSNKAKQKSHIMEATLNENEFYRVNSYYWQDRVYIALEIKDDKTLCKVKDSKSKPSWIKTEQLSKIYRDFKNE